MAPRAVAETYYAVSERFGMDNLLDRISLLPAADRWQSLARMALRYDLYAALAGLTRVVLETDAGRLPAADAGGHVGRGQLRQHHAGAQHAQHVARGCQADLATLSVVLRQIRTVVRASAA